MPFTPVPIEITPETTDYFWSRVDQSPHPKGCWIWRGGRRGQRSDHRYGVIGTGRHRPGAHRYSWALHNGPIPDGLDILHKCDNPVCVNPAHLFPGTHQQNMEDRNNKKRAAGLRGAENKASKLTQAQVDEIRKLCAKGYSNRELGEMYGVSNTSIYYIRHGINWPDRTPKQLSLF